MALTFAQASHVLKALREGREGRRTGQLASKLKVHVLIVHCRRLRNRSGT